MAMEWKLELVPIPVSDVDTAKQFYAEKLGFRLDHDVTTGPQFRVVQLTPPGSACSICFGRGIVKTPPGSVQGLHLVVPDIHAARAQLVERGVQSSEIQELGAGIFFVFFKDPDGNSWAVQHIAPEARTSKGDKS
ncbi:MAG TPA: VOC family protein [Gemmatimonadaceae bacterium]|nr:VOC family protein [Gemmatimonadaceae bacterium]